MRQNYRFFLGRNIPDTHFSVSVNEVKLFIRQFDYVTGYSMIHGEGMYEGEEEEFTQLDIFAITQDQARNIASCYKERFRQKEVLIDKLNMNIESV